MQSLSFCFMCHSRVAPRAIQVATTSPRFVSSSFKPPTSRQQMPSPTPFTKYVYNPSDPSPHIKELLDAIRYYEHHYTYRGWHVLRVIGLAGIAIAGVVIYFWKDTKSILSKETSDLAQQTMQDEALQAEVDRITQQMTNTLLNDPKTARWNLSFHCCKNPKRALTQWVLWLTSWPIQPRYKHSPNSYESCYCWCQILNFSKSSCCFICSFSHVVSVAISALNLTRVAR